MEELKPCPFCGGEAILLEDWKDGNFIVGCANNDCIVRLSGIPSFDNAEQAVKAWNTRAERTCHFDQTDKIPTISGMIRVWECSNCGHECEELNGVYEYCPHCKAKVIDDANV